MPQLKINISALSICEDRTLKSSIVIHKMERNTSSNVKPAYISVVKYLLEILLLCFFYILLTQEYTCLKDLVFLSLIDKIEFQTQQYDAIIKY